MKHIITGITLALAVSLSSGALAPARAADEAVKLTRAQVTGIEDNVITVAYTERGRKVYDPLLVTPETTVYRSGKPVALKTVRLRQYLWVTAVRTGDELVASRIDIGGPPPKPKTKPAVKPGAKNVVVAPKQ